ncbi:LamG-like jellyroll fold domain-containing protein, partial [Actinoplanes sp. NPDC051633]|uniref:LamG domain-containing protein n=1 Tax=Actinoplanes sp. NPDC051633 TaxID=3155670 RepID=UPI00342930C3
VNGSLHGTGRLSSAWNATGNLQIGRSKIAGSYAEPWRGRIDEVTTWDRVLTTDEIRRMANAPVEEAFLPMDEGAGTSVADVSGNYRMGRSSGELAWDAGRVGPFSAQFNGRDAAIETAQQAVRTDGSFTVTARARLRQENPQSTQTIVSQDGPSSSGFALQYRNGRWAFLVSRADKAVPDRLTAEAPVDGAEWTDLVGVYDAAAGEVRLYVNSAEKGAAPGRVTAHVPGSLVVGRAKQAGAATQYFDGWIDDVHAWTGAFGAAEAGRYSENPVTRRPNPYGAELARFVDHDGHHFSGTGPVPPGMLIEPGLGIPAASGTPDTRMLYSCRYPGGWYNTTVDRCETADSTLLGAAGLVHKSAPAGRPSLRVYRCVVAGADHYLTTVEGCESPEHRNEGTMGFTRAYRQLVRHLSPAPQYDHITTVTLGGVPPGYRAEGTQGILGLTAEPGTQGLYSCTTGTDEFSSTDPGCEGETVRRWEGAIWTQPPSFAESLPLYSCRMTPAADGERFTSRDEFCEGRTRIGRLGFVITRFN